MLKSVFLQLLIPLLIQLPLSGHVDWEVLMREDICEIEEEEEEALEEIFEKGIDSSEQDERISTPVDIEPSAMVNNSVNIITGKYQDFEVDFSLTGVESFALQRAYISADTHKRGPLGKGWCHNYFAMARKSGEDTLMVMESFGSTLNFSSTKQNKYIIDASSIERGTTNCGGGFMGGRTNVHNNHWHREKENKTCLLEKSSGSKLTFAKHNRHDDHLKHYWQVSTEKLPNGNTRRYTYDKKCRIESIEAENSVGKALGELKFRYAKTYKGYPLVYVATPSNNLVRYEFVKLKGKGLYAESAFYIASVIREQGPPLSYTYDTKAKIVKISRKSLPDNRFEEIDYYAKGHNQVNGRDIAIKWKRDPRIQKVKQQKAPVGTDATPIPTYKYVYSDTEGYEAGHALVSLSSAFKS